MGGEQWKNRKHLLFYGACFLIIILTFDGCIIPVGKIKGLPGAATPVEKASRMVSEGNYDGALKEYTQIARSYPGESPGDRALFEMGLIWAYPDNPRKNHREALKYFQRFLRDFPGSPLKEEARAWEDVLNKITRYDSRLTDLEEKLTSCKGEIIAYQEEISGYKKQISALKEIDIGIEEKKRKGLLEE